MRSIVYGGLKYFQVRNAIYCKKCKTSIESTSSQDFKMCPCNSVGIDGGLESPRIVGNINDLETRSLYLARVGHKKLWLPQNVIEQYFLDLVKN
jgi:hypothetical protein